MGHHNREWRRRARPCRSLPCSDSVAWKPGSDLQFEAGKLSVARRFSSFGLADGARALRTMSAVIDAEGGVSAGEGALSICDALGRSRKGGHWRVFAAIFAAGGKSQHADGRHY